MNHLRRVLTALIAVAAVVMLNAAPASAAPLATTATIQPGGSIAITGGPSFGLGTPACSDGADNDADGLVDFPNDPGCASAADANERLAGLQTYVAPTIAGVWESTTNAISGVVMTFPSSEVCITSTQCLTVTISQVNAADTGTLNPATGVGSLTTKLMVDLDNAVGFGSIPANCRIDPIPTTGTATLSTSNYNSATGTATYTASGVAIPGTTGCGFIFGPIINAYMGLPGTVSLTVPVVFSPAPV